MSDKNLETQTQMDAAKHNDVSSVTRRRPTFTPRTDIYETPENLVVLADMPGVDEGSVDIQVERNVLSLIGEIGAEEVGGRQIGYAEYEGGRYERQFTLSDEVDVHRIEASVKDGVLRIVLPKAEAAKPRKITVNAG